jgi:trehalose/maltose hydrolase-like predicted phosphorylase
MEPLNLWNINEKNLDNVRAELHSQETVYSIGNGYFCTRGTFEEGYPGAEPATLLYGVFDKIPLAGEELANAPDWTPLQLFANGERFRLDRGHVLEYERTLDMEHAVLRRTVRWQSPTGLRLLIATERFASLADEHAGFIRYSVTVEQAMSEVDIVLLASLNTAVGNENVMHWRTVDQGHQGDLIWLRSVTRGTGVELAQSMSFTTDNTDFHPELIDSDIAPAIRLRGKLAPGSMLTTEKIVVMYTSRDEGEPQPSALSAHQKILASGYDTHLARHQQAWRQFWQDADILIEGDDDAQRGIRYCLYQLRINASSHDSRYSIAAKGLTGFGYHGHIFHDTEIFMLPFFTYTLPEIARNLLIYRYNTLPAARQKAWRNGYEGAQYAWESTLSGAEMTPPAIVHPESSEVVPVLNGSLEIHISASIAYAVWQYWKVSGDDEFMCRYGAEMILNTALFWGSRVEKNQEKDRYEITNVIGPDEWHEHVNNNAFTNYMARWNLQIALTVLDWLRGYDPERARVLVQQLELTDQRLDHWRDVIKRMYIPMAPGSSLIEQFDGFFQLEPLDRERYRRRKVSYQGILGTTEIQKYRCIKQADVLMLLTLLDQEFDLQTKRVNWNYYYPITDHNFGSSLTPAFHVMLACELGKLREAYELFMKGCLVDLENLRGNTPEGIHTACCGSVWQAAIFGFAGLRVTEGGYTTNPHLPDGWTRLAFSFIYRGKRERVDLSR